MGGANLPFGSRKRRAALTTECELYKETHGKKVTAPVSRCVRYAVLLTNRARLEVNFIEENRV